MGSSSHRHGNTLLDTCPATHRNVDSEATKYSTLRLPRLPQAPDILLAERLVSSQRKSVQSRQWLSRPPVEIFPASSQHRFLPHSIFSSLAMSFKLIVRILLTPCSCMAASSQSPLCFVPACGENSARSLAPPLPAGTADAGFRWEPWRHHASLDFQLLGHVVQIDGQDLAHALFLHGGVVPKSALLRSRLRRKLRPLPCSSASRRNR